ncbi:MAG TPA: hypothetical protein VG937_07995 [Polyangiaceae bacterium]|nr:hypothetical protein [Polyangiaceae bacterium]
MSFFDSIKGLFDKDRQNFIDVVIPTERVDRSLETPAIQAGLHYFRIWMPSMFLKKEVAWFSTLYPAVHSLVKLTFGDNQVELPNIADSTKLGIQPKGGQGDVISKNYLLLPTMPFNGGVVSLVTGLVAVTGENYLNNFIRTLGSFADLLAVPQLSAALKVAGPLTAGIQDLFGQGNGRLHLGYTRTFAAADLVAGYYAVLRAKQGELDPKYLSVKEERLLYKGEPLTGFDHLLLRIEVFSERDDWDQLTSINAPFKAALRALQTQDELKANMEIVAAIRAAYEAPELSRAHQQVVIRELKSRYQQAKNDFLLSGLGETTMPTTLAGVMKGMAVNKDILDRPRMSLTDAMTFG